MKRLPQFACVLAFLWLAAIPAAIAGTHAAEGTGPVEFTFLYVQTENDSVYQPNRAYTGLVLKDRRPPLAGAESGLRESLIIGRSAGLKFSLQTALVGQTDDIAGEIRSAAAGVGARIVLLDLPLDLFRKAVDRLGQGDDLILFNIRYPDDVFREAGCAPALFHTMPSTSMLTDALAQYLRSRSWTRVLVLAGEGDEDAAFAAGFERSARKFGLTIVGKRAFVPGNDPRDREKNNIALLTGGPDYDVIFLADNDGDFGRYVPYGTYLARPVVGSEGLTPSAWHWTWERYGAPQLNQRFDRKAKRQMQSADWAAWAAIRSVVEAVVRSGSHDVKSIRARLTSDDFTFDTYKGVPANFRLWNNQLRQPILLHTHNAVIARAPIEGFLHEINVLDSLGPDRRDSECPLRSN